MTDKQERFVQELIKGKSQREAYRIAYPASIKWKEDIIDQAACRLLKNNKVLARYNTIHDRLIKEAEDECIVEAKDVLRELKAIGFADIKDFLTYKTVQSVVGYGDTTGAPILDYRQVIDMKDSDDVDGRLIQEVSVNAKGVFSFKLYDKMNALEKLGKHLGMFRDNIELTGKGGGPVEFTVSVREK